MTIPLDTMVQAPTLPSTENNNRSLRGQDALRGTEHFSKMAARRGAESRSFESSGNQHLNRDAKTSNFGGFSNITPWDGGNVSGKIGAPANGGYPSIIGPATIGAHIVPAPPSYSSVTTGGNPVPGNSSGSGASFEGRILDLMEKMIQLLAALTQKEQSGTPVNGDKGGQRPQIPGEMTIMPVKVPHAERGIEPAVIPYEGDPIVRTADTVPGFDDPQAPSGGEIYHDPDPVIITRYADTVDGFDNPGTEGDKTEPFGPLPEFSAKSDNPLQDAIDLGLIPSLGGPQQTIEPASPPVIRDPTVHSPNPVSIDNGNLGDIRVSVMNLMLEMLNIFNEKINEVDGDRPEPYFPTDTSHNAPETGQMQVFIDQISQLTQMVSSRLSGSSV